MIFNLTIGCSSDKPWHHQENGCRRPLHTLSTQKQPCSRHSSLPVSNCPTQPLFHKFTQKVDRGVWRLTSTGSQESDTTEQLGHHQNTGPSFPAPHAAMEQPSHHVLFSPFKPSHLRNLSAASHCVAFMWMCSRWLMYSL